MVTGKEGDYWGKGGYWERGVAREKRSYWERGGYKERQGNRGLWEKVYVYIRRHLLH